MPRWPNTRRPVAAPPWATGSANLTASPRRSRWVRRCRTWWSASPAWPTCTRRTECCPRSVLCCWISFVPSKPRWGPAPEHGGWPPAGKRSMRFLSNRSIFSGAIVSEPLVQFLFDFGSPNAYLSHKVLPDIAHRCGVDIEYVPVLLGGLFKMTNNRSPAESMAGIRNKPEYEEMERQRFIRRHRLDAYRFNPYFPVNTLQIMRGAVAAGRLGVFERYVDAVVAA